MRHFCFKDIDIKLNVVHLLDIISLDINACVDFVRSLIVFDKEAKTTFY